MRGNLAGYQDYLVVKAMNASAETEIAIGTPLSIVQVCDIMDGSQKATTVASVAEWMPIVESTIGNVDTLHIGFAMTVFRPYIFLDSDEGIKTHEGLGSVLICGEGFVTLGVDNGAIGDELYLATTTPGSGRANVTAVTNVAADELREVAIALEAGGDGDTIRAFIFPFPRDYVAPV